MSERPILSIAVHDFGGYPFIVELSRELAGRGHNVVHLYADGFRAPGEQMAPTAAYPSLTLQPITLAESIERGGWRRVAQERRYGRLLADRISGLKPDVVISANSPLEVQAAAADAAEDTGAAFVFWLQDLHSVAIARVLSRRSRTFGRLVGWRFERIEKRLLRHADAIVAISGDFLPVLQRWGVAAEAVEVIENWAPIDEEDHSAGSVQWAAEHGLRHPLVLYAGTLAFKHNPALLMELARGSPRCVRRGGGGRTGHGLAARAGERAGEPPRDPAPADRTSAGHAGGRRPAGRGAGTGRLILLGSLEGSDLSLGGQGHPGGNAG